MLDAAREVTRGCRIDLLLLGNLEQEVVRPMARSVISRRIGLDRVARCSANDLGAKEPSVARPGADVLQPDAAVADQRRTE